jgi:hypothetical protein
MMTFFFRGDDAAIDIAGGFLNLAASVFQAGEEMETRLPPEAVPAWR